MKRKGFTLIELIVVMAILGILVFLGQPKYLEYTEQARLTKIVVQAKELEKASLKYYMTHNAWPRLGDAHYTSEEVKLFSEKIMYITGEVIELDSNGNYYDIDYVKINNYIKEPHNKEYYILQNPVGAVYILEKVTESGIKRIEWVTNETEKYPDGAIALSEVPLGGIVYDETWMWEYKIGDLRPVEWIVAAKKHIDYPSNSVTLLTSELISNHIFDNRIEGRTGYPNGICHWGNSGTLTAKKGIRKYLNGSSYEGDDKNSYPITFYDAFSTEFKDKILLTTLVNKDVDYREYYTEDKVFIPSEYELTGNKLESPQVGYKWGGINSTNLVAMRNGVLNWYWTRTPQYNNNVRYISIHGKVTPHTYSDPERIGGLYHGGVRPALNISDDIMVVENENGKYKILY